jgi:hypothetical protein
MFRSVAKKTNLTMLQKFSDVPRDSFLVKLDIDCYKTNKPLATLSILWQNMAIKLKLHIKGKIPKGLHRLVSFTIQTLGTDQPISGIWSGILEGDWNEEQSTIYRCLKGVSLRVRWISAEIAILETVAKDFPSAVTQII